MRQRSGGQMKRLRPDGASSSGRSRNASGLQSTSRITPGALSFSAIDQSLAYEDYFPASPQDQQRQLRSGRFGNFGRFESALPHEWLTIFPMRKFTRARVKGVFKAPKSPKPPKIFPFLRPMSCVV